VFATKIQFSSVQPILIAYAEFNYLGREFSEKLLLRNRIGLGAHLELPQLEPGLIGGVCLDLLFGFNAYVQYVATTEYYVPVIGGWRITAVFRCSFQYDVHVAVGVDHLSSVLDIVLEPNVDFRVEFLYEQVEWFS
jgi:hypothetical protein